MFGKDFLKPQEKPISSIERNEKEIIFYYTSSLGDKFKFIFIGPKRENYLKIAQDAFESLINDTYTLLPQNQIYLMPSNYWTIYKRWPEGKGFLTVKNNARVFINDQRYRFVEPYYYFNVDKESPGGVYGIYYHDELIYVGSSTQDMVARWKEHDAYFRSKGDLNEMYRFGYDPNEIEYRTLKTGDEIAETIGVNRISSWLIEYTEYIYIDIFKPKWNKEGNTKPFEFKVREADIPISHWKTFKEFLVSSHSSMPDSLMNAEE